jgi:hypothetical protein
MKLIDGCRSRVSRSRAGLPSVLTGARSAPDSAGRRRETVTRQCEFSSQVLSLPLRETGGPILSINARDAVPDGKLDQSRQV